jgi:hypothetical protein
VYALIPDCLGLSPGEIALMIGRQPYLNVLLLAGLACCVVSVVPVIWHANWIRLRSIRDRVGD